MLKIAQILNIYFKCKWKGESHIEKLIAVLWNIVEARFAVAVTTLQAERANQEQYLNALF